MNGNYERCGDTYGVLPCLLESLGYIDSVLVNALHWLSSLNFGTFIVEIAT